MGGEQWEPWGTRFPSRAALWSWTDLQSLWRVREKKKKSKVKLGKKESLAYIVNLRVNFGGDTDVQSLHPLKPLTGIWARQPWCPGCGPSLSCAADPSQASLTQLPAPAGVWKDLPLPSAAVNIASRRSAHGLLRSALREMGPPSSLSFPFLLRCEDRTGTACRKGPGGQPTAACRRALAPRPRAALLA